MLDQTLLEKTYHDIAVAGIARQLLGFPNVERPSWATYRNEPVRTAGLDDGATTYYPDLVVVDATTQAVVAFAEVETEASVTEADAERWARSSRLALENGCNFYVFVPAGLGARARRYRGLTFVDGLYTYAFDERGKLEVRDVTFWGN